MEPINPLYLKNMKVRKMDSTEIEKYKNLLKDEELVDYLIGKGGETQWFYEKYLYFFNCVGEKCKYADACLKMIRGDIDEFYSRRETNNVT